MRNKNKICYLSVLVLLFGCSKKFTKEYNNNIEDLNKFQTFIETENTETKEENSFPEKSYCKRADINFKDLPFSSLPSLLSTIYDTQINTNQDSDIQVSITHFDICLDELLEELTDLYDIGYTKNHFGYTIEAKTLKTKFFTINYHNFKRSGSSNINIQGGTSLSGDSGGSGQSSIQTAVEDTFWNDVAQIIATLTGANDPSSNRSQNSSSDDASFSIYKESGIVVVNAYPKALKRVEKFINKINSNCSEQINIEAKILEITLSDEFQTGVDWNALASGKDSAGNTTYNINLKNTQSMQGLTDLATSELNLKSTISKTFAQTIAALSAQGKVSVLSSPKISVLNNQKAIFKFGADEYYITGITATTNNTIAPSSNTSNNNIATTTPTAIATPEMKALFSGISLDATPNIVNDNQIIMHIHPSITQVKEEKKTFTIADQSTTIPMASIQTREADTVVKATSGDIIVVGGLMQNKVNKVKSGPQIRTPLLDRLFGTKREFIEKTELIVLLRPVIVRSKIASYDFSKYLLDEQDENRPPLKKFQHEFQSKDIKVRNLSNR